MPNNYSVKSDKLDTDETTWWLGGFQAVSQALFIYTKEVRMNKLQKLNQIQNSMKILDGIFPRLFLFTAYGVGLDALWMLWHHNSQATALTSLAGIFIEIAQAWMKAQTDKANNTEG